MRSTNQLSGASSWLRSVCFCATVLLVAIPWCVINGHRDVSAQSERDPRARQLIQSREALHHLPAILKRLGEESVTIKAFELITDWLAQDSICELLLDALRELVSEFLWTLFEFDLDDITPYRTHGGVI